ncbi:MAG: hypothetical protein ABGY41_13840 [Candidatus Poribacteria bacterium]
MPNTAPEGRDGSDIGRSFFYARLVGGMLVTGGVPTASSMSDRGYDDPLHLPPYQEEGWGFWVSPQSDGNAVCRLSRRAA